MVQQYCHNCGKKMPQASLKFCPHCGTNLASLAAGPPKEEVPEPPKPSRTSTFRQPKRERFVPETGMDDDDEDTYANAEELNIDISKLEVEITPIRQVKETIGGLMAQGPGEADGFARGGLNLSEVDVVKILSQEGSALRPKGGPSTDNE